MPIDVVEFAENLIILEDGKRICFEPHQKKILRHVFSFDTSGKLPYSMIIYSAPKKSGKTTVGGIVTVWFGSCVDAPTELLICANDLEQSTGRTYKSARRFFERNPILRQECVTIGKTEIELRNGTIITAIPVDYAGEAGANQSLALFDELWGYRSERSRRLFEELTPVPTRKNSLQFITTYAGHEGESELLEEQYHKIFNDDGTVKDGIERPLGEDLPCYAKGDLFVYWDHEARMPWQTPEYYESQKQHLRTNTYLRLHKNMWVSSESGLFDMERWDGCVDPDHSPPLSDRSIKLWVGVDASVKKDRSAVVSVYRDDDKLKLGPKRFWQPTSADPMDLEETMEAYLLDLKRGYVLAKVLYDPFQFHRSATTLSKKGLPMEEYPQTGSNLTACGQNLYDLVTYRNIVLYACKDLRHEATCAIAKETGRGLRIVKEKSTHKIDQIVALSMAAFGVTSQKEPLAPPPAPSWGYMEDATPEKPRPELPEDLKWIEDW